MTDYIVTNSSAYLNDDKELISHRDGTRPYEPLTMSLETAQEWCDKLNEEHPGAGYYPAQNQEDAQ